MNILMNDPNGSYDAMMGRAQLIRTLKEKDEQLSAAEAERDRLREAVSLMYDAMTDKAGAWIRARIWLDAHDIYHGDLQENAVLAEVCRAALDAGKEQPHDV